MMSAKMATSGLLKIKVFWNKGYYVIYSVYDVTNKILSHDPSYIVDAVMWSKFGNSSICIREVIITSIYKDLTRKTAFFGGWSWLKFNDLGLAPGTNLKFYASLSKGLKLILTFQKALGANSYVCRSYRGKTGRGPFCPPPPPSWIGLIPLPPLRLWLHKMIYISE